MEKNGNFVALPILSLSDMEATVIDLLRLRIAVNALVAVKSDTSAISLANASNFKNEITARRQQKSGIHVLRMRQTMI